jgi:uncharacterized membrane protein
MLAQAALFNAIKAAGPTRADALKRMDAVAHLLDTAFLVPGTRQRVGIDAIIGLVPGIGDLVTTLLSSYVIWEARQLGLPRHVIGRMLLNLGIHSAVGAVPLAGDAFVALFRVNRRNMRIVREHLDKEFAAARVEAGPVERAR